MFLMFAVTLGELPSWLWTISTTVIGLGFVIFIHELGHFLAAKACGVKCEKFYVGFDVPISIGPIQLPRTLLRFQWGETEYGIGIIPLGGYVKMLGQDDDPRNAEAERQRIMVAEGGAGDADADSGAHPPARSARAGDEESPDAASDGEEPMVLDPRSFPAKPVWQRMVIISAGVIMNLISAVFLAAAAYAGGVLISPCEFAGTAPGDPAWEANVRPGSKLIQFGKEGQPDEHLRFDWELRQKVVHAGFEADRKPMDLLIRPPQGEPQWYSILPSDRMKEMGRPATLGVRPPFSNRIAKKKPVRPLSPASRAEPPLQGGDRVIKVDGKPLDASNANKMGDLRAEQVELYFSQAIGRPVTLTIERKDASGSPKTLQVVVPPAPRRDLGLAMEIGPIVAIRTGSPAAAAGLKTGDILRRWRRVTPDGGEPLQPIGDPVTLPQVLTPLVGQELELEVERRTSGESRLELIRLTPAGEVYYPPNMGAGARKSIETLGIAYEIESVVASITPDGPAAKAGMQAGDKVLKSQLQCTDPATLKIIKDYMVGFNEEIELTGQVFNWLSVLYSLQVAPPENVSVKLTFKRAGKIQEAIVTPRNSDQFFVLERGVRWSAFERVHTASSWGEALSLGWRETSEKFVEVLRVLRLLFTGRVSPANLGGPVAIAAMAGSEASKGIPRLLLFLTFLSCNLAIINFLPIPALDGGHMLFLTAEAVLGRPVDERWQTALTLVGVVCLLGLMVFVIGNDVRKLIW